MPLAVLLAGPTGSAKTTVAQALAARGFTRLSVDEEVHRLHGRYGVDYPERTYFERERPVVEAIRQRLIKEVQAALLSSTSPPTATSCCVASWCTWPSAMPFPMAYWERD
ncbi:MULTISPECIES: AAA family ATPase [unclassified Streptomyces]|uniref:AAA family ATPase n=1 Tax=unclassified Streptomyces TaxID=2593676 RepID=UPI0033BD79D0